MRVLHVDPERGWGGGEAQVLALVGELAARGHASALAVDPEGPLARAVADLAGRGMPLDVRPLRIRNHLDLPAGLALRRMIPGHDVVHFHTARAHALAPFCRRGSVRLVVTRRMDYVPAGGLYARYLYNRAVDVVIAISAGVRAALLAAGVHADRIHVVPSGIEPARLSAPPDARALLRREWGLAAHHVAVLVPAVLERRKGHAVLLAAAAELTSRTPDLRYVFCGDGHERAALERLAARLDGAVRFAGFRRDMPACLAAADVAVLPSLQEGLGVAALEAMAVGRPVVASRVGGLAEVVVDGETGLLVPPGEPRPLADALARLAADPGLRTRLGAAGRARVLAHYTSARMAAGTLACYEA